MKKKKIEKLFRTKYDPAIHHIVLVRNEYQLYEKHGNKIKKIPLEVVTLKGELKKKYTRISSLQKLLSKEHLFLNR